MLRMADRDLPAVTALRDFIGVGSIQHDRPPRRATWQPTVNYTVTGPPRHPDITSFPFCDTFLIAGAKRHAVPAAGASGSRTTKQRFPSNWGAGPSPCADRRLRQSRCEDGGCAVPTTTRRRATDVADLIGGFVAAEGCFQARPVTGRFAFAVALGAADREMVDLLHGFLGCGRTTWRRRRQSPLRRRGHASWCAACVTSSR